MPIPVLRACAAAIGCAAALTLFASLAEAKTIPAELRVVDSDGTVLADGTQYASKEDVKVKTDRRADCFGPGTGGSGDKVDVPGGSALAQLVDAGRADRDLRPLSISDSFDFGLALCGIGEAVAPQTGFWYLKTDHEASQTGGDLTTIGKGEEVLWFLIEDFNDPIPAELSLSAPLQDADGSVEVKVLSYADNGERTPAAGVQVTGADQPTGADGTVTVDGDADVLELTATADGSIPSNEERVCTLPKLGDCPAGFAETIAGTGEDDKIATGKDAETILAGGGDDRITASSLGKAPDLVKCGGGDDKVTGYRKASDETRFVGCEKVR